MPSSGTPSGVQWLNARYRGYHVAYAPFNPRLRIFEPSGFSWFDFPVFKNLWLSGFSWFDFPVFKNL